MKVGISSELQEILRVAVEDGMSKEDSKDLRVAGSDPTKFEKYVRRFNCEFARFLRIARVHAAQDQLMMAATDEARQRANAKSLPSAEVKAADAEGDADDGNGAEHGEEEVATQDEEVAGTG